MKRLILLLLVALVLGCSGKHEDIQAKTLVLHVVHGPELRPLMSSVKEKFYLANHVLPDGSRVVMEPVNELAVQASRKLATGELKTEAWIAPSSALIAFTNQNVVNLGSRQVECAPLFATPVIVAVRADDADMLGATESHFSWRSVMNQSALAEKGPANAANSKKPILFSHAFPITSTTGLAALSELSYLVSFGKQGPVTPAAGALLRDQLKSFERSVYSYGMSESHLLDRIARSSSDAIRAVITTEQQLASFNHDNAGRVAPLVALYPDEGSYWEDYQICVSSADWVTPAQRAGIRELREFLQGDLIQREAVRRGFRSVAKQLNAVAPLTPQFGVTPSLPKNFLAPLPPEVVDTILNGWNDFSRPAALVFVLDASGSMEGQPILAAKDALRKALATSDNHTVTGLVAFSAQPKIVSPMVRDATAVMHSLDTLQAGGGSAIYDGIKQAVLMLSAKEWESYRKGIVVITDGQDKNSEISIDSLLALIRERGVAGHIELSIVGIDHEPTDFADLMQISKAAGGSFQSGMVQQIPSLLNEGMERF